MNHNILTPLSILLAFLPLSAAYAQQDSTLNRTVVVENEYNPSIMDASKINVLPRIEEPAVVKKGIEYATALRPVATWTYENMSAIHREWPQASPRRGYARVGYGNNGNVDVKAGYLWDLTANDRLRIAASLDGMNGTLKNRFDQDWKARFYTTDFRLNYRHQFAKATLRLGGGLTSRVFNYMNVFDVEDGPLYTASTPVTVTDKQHHTLGDFYIGVSSRNEDLPLQFSLQTGLKYFDIKYPTDYVESAGTEKIIHTVADVWGKLNDEQRVGVQVQMDNLIYAADSAMSNYTSLELNPYYQLEGEDWKIRLGAHVDWQSGDDSGIDVAPDVQAEYRFADSYVLYLQAVGGRELNDYRRLAAFSPYWSLREHVTSTYVPLNATLGFKASPTNGLWLNVFGGYRISNDELSAASFPERNELVYTRFLQNNAKTAYGGAEVKYGYKDLFDASLKGTYYSWSTDSPNEDLFLSSKPKMELDFRAEAKVFEGLRVQAGYHYVQRREYLTRGANGDLADTGLGNISDLSVGATYRFWKEVAVFGRVNNLLNKQYYTDYGYPAQKLNVLFGLSCRF